MSKYSNLIKKKERKKLADSDNFLAEFSALFAESTSENGKSNGKNGGDEVGTAIGVTRLTTEAFTLEVGNSFGDGVFLLNRSIKM